MLYLIIMSLIKTLYKILSLKINFNEQTLSSPFFLKKYNVRCLLIKKENKNFFFSILAKRNLINYFNNLILKKYLKYKVL